MTITLDPPVTAVRRPGWLLVATLPAYAAYLAVAVTTIAQQAHSSADLTPAEIDLRLQALPGVQRHDVVVPDAGAQQLA